MAKKSLTVGDRAFWVTATRDIDEDIKKGDHVLIDPDRAPVPGKRVLIDGRLEVWDGQKDGAAQAVQVSRRVDGAMLGFYSDESEAANG